MATTSDITQVIKFLRDKDIIIGDYEKWMVRSMDGREFNIIELLHEYKSVCSTNIELTQSEKHITETDRQFNELLRRSSCIMSDLMADDFYDCLGKFKSDVIEFFTTYPTFDTIDNRKLLGFQVN